VIKRLFAMQDIILEFMMNNAGGKLRKKI